MKKQIKKIIENILRGLAIKLLSNNKLDIIGITGSAGKSSAKEAVYQVLSKSKELEKKVKKSEGNLNTEIGLPLAILGFRSSPSIFTWPFILIWAYFRANVSSFNPLKKTSVLILEYAADKPGDIEHLLSIAKPKIAIVTSIGVAHTEFFESVENIAKEKGQLIENLPQNGFGIIGKDNLYAKEIANNSRAKIMYFDDKASDPAKEIAEKVGLIYKLQLEEIKSVLTQLQPLPGRLNILKGIKNTTIIDDSYNSNPLSAKKSLKYLEDYSSKYKKTAILGDMRELGELSKQSHEEIAEEIAKSADMAIIIGPMMVKWAKPVLNKLSCPYFAFSNFSEAKDKIINSVHDNDVILIKGSQNTLFLERITEMLLADKNDKNKLCRRGYNWDKLRARTP